MSLKEKKALHRAYKSGSRAVLEKSFEETYETYKNLIWHIALDILDDKDSAEDAVQKCFADFFNSILKGKGRIKNVKYYLVSSIKYICWEMNRKKKVLPLDDERLNQETTVAQIDDSEDVIKMLAPRDKEEKRIVRMRIYDEMKFKEIAKTLHVSINVVTSKYQRAIKKVRDNYLAEQKGKDVD